MKFFESLFNQKAKQEIRNWQEIPLTATFILKKSTFKGHSEALNHLKAYKTFKTWEQENEVYFSVEFSLLSEDSFHQLKNATTKVRKFTEIEIEGNYFNPTDVGLAFYLMTSKTDNEFNSRKEAADRMNTKDRIDNALKIKDYLNSYK